MNKSGVALAADSKVTIGPASSPKTYDTVNKLFTLSKVHPVGIMIHGNAEFMGFPWETIVKIYREQKKADSEATVAEWATSFLEYLATFGNIRPTVKEENISGIVASGIQDALYSARQAARARRAAPSSQEFQQILLDELEERSSTLRGKGEWLKGKEANNLIRTYDGLLEKIVTSYFDRFNNSKINSAAKSLAVLSLVGTQLSTRSSGIVFAGFGDSEYFSTLIEYNTDGYVGDVIKYVHNNTMDIARDMPAAIHAFAQGDMVQRFMNGFDSEFFLTIFELYGESHKDACLQILEQYGAAENKTDAVRQAIRGASNKAIKKLGDMCVGISIEKFSMPIIQMVGLLPKDELPHLAESLVALTSLKRRISRDVESVGGPIDVALISKGDGVIWIKRKHYFTPELNPQFARNYMRSIDGGDDDGRPGRTPSRPQRTSRKPKSPPPQRTRGQRRGDHRQGGDGRA